MLIEEIERLNRTEKSLDNRFYFAVCLSQTNFTTAKYPKPVKLQVGMMFYSGDTKYQVLKILRDAPQAPDSDDDDRTMTLLPGDRKSNGYNHTTNSESYAERVTFFILSGPDRNK